MTTDKSLVIETSQIYRHRSFGYESQNLYRFDNQVFILVFFENSKQLQ